MGSYAVVGTVNADVQTYNDLGLTPNTTYTYRMYSYNTAGNSPTYSNEVTLTTNNVIFLPTLTTTTPTTITNTTASSGGTISNDGGGTVNTRGLVWSTSSNPTISLSTKTTDGAGTGNFTSSITGLTANTTYYIRAYANNSLGTAYGNELNFTTIQNSPILNIPGTNVTDFDGNIYHTITNCNQTWTQSNLNVSHYRNGDAIPQVTDPAAWANLTTGAWCYNNNDSANGVVYGKLYNWYAVNDSRGLAPSGYHIPTNTEWTTLTDCLGGEPIAGGKMKEIGTTHWQNPNIGADNTSGFIGIPGGRRTFTGTFDGLNTDGRWWSSSEVLTSTTAWYRYMFNYDVYLINGGITKTFGISVRCLKD
jgi:uncharacterized protein (TIGR02145 family)